MRMDAFGFGQIDIAGIGDNRPPEFVRSEALVASLETKNTALLERRDELLAAEARLPAITNDEIAGKVGDFIKEIMQATKNAETLRVGEKEPYLTAGKLVDSFYKGISAPLENLKARVEAVLGKYLRDKADSVRLQREADERAKTEEAERAQREALAALITAMTDEEIAAAKLLEAKAKQAESERFLAANAAAATPAEMARSRGDLGSLATLRTRWVFEIEDMTQIPRDYLVVNDAAIRAHIKARRKGEAPLPIPGIKFVETTDPMVR